MSPFDHNTPAGPAEARLARLFAEYRQALPDPEPDAAFMPGLWARIDARRSASRDLRRLAQGFLTAAAAVSLLMGVFLARPTQQVSPFYTSTYLELLAADQGQNTEEVELVRIEPATYENSR